MSLQYTKIHTVTGYTSGDYDIAFTFDYLDDTDIKVYKTDTSVAPLIYGTDWVFENKKTIKLLSASANFTIADNDVFQIQRETQISTSHVTFAPGSPVRAEDLNSNQLQSLYAAQEREDRGINKNGENDVTGRVIFRDNVLGFEGPTANDYETYFAAVEPTQDNTISIPNITGTLITDADTGTVSRQMIAGDAIDGSKIDDDVVDSEHYVAGSIDEEHLADQAVTSVKIADGTIVNADINASADIDGSKIASGTIDFDRIKPTDITQASDYAASDWTDALVNDTKVATIGAIAARHDVEVGTSLPTTTQPGKGFLNITPGNQEYRVFDGSGWRLVASGQPYSPNTATIVRYVDVTNGSDAADVTGFLPNSPLKSIGRAVELVNSDGSDGTVIKVAAGVYQETLPIQIERKNISIVGEALRSVFVQPTQATETNTMFECNTGTLLANMTFVGLKASGTRGNSTYDGDATYGLPENQGWCAAFYSGATIKKSPYIQNCTSFNDSSIDNSIKYDQTNLPAGGLGGDQTSAMSGGGILCDGSVPATSSPLRSFVVDSFTQINLDGPGILVTNSGYAQLVSFFGTFCHYHAKALNGGQINLSNCTTDFGRYGLIADGRSNAKITGSSVGTTAANATSIVVDGLTLQNNFFSNQPGSTMVMEVGGESYQVLSASAVSSNTSTINIYRATDADPNTNLGFKAQVNDNSAVTFKLRSYISTGGHTFEYVGSGTDYTAHPDYGGIAVEANQVVELGGDGTSDDQIYNRGKVWQSSTDENGKFKVGDKFQVDQRLGTITLDGFTVAAEVVSDTTPQLGGDLDLNNSDITGTGNIDINGDIHLKDNYKIRLGSASGGDFQLYFSGTNTFFKQTAGDLKYELADQFVVQKDTGDEPIAIFNSDSDVELYYDGAKKFETSSTGVTVTGTVAATAYTGDGSGLTGVGGDVVLDTTPQLGGDLDIQGFDITTSTTNGNIDLTANGTGLIRVTENGLSQVPIVTQHDIGTAANEIPLNQYLGTAAFQDSDNFSVGNLQVATAYTVATLPSSPSVGRVARVTDASSPSVGATVTGGAAAAALCWYNGTNWTVIGV